MLSLDEFREEYPPEELSAELPDTPISGLRSLQHLYGTLYTLATTGGGEYPPYITPDAASDLIDQDDSLIIVRADFSEDEPQLASDKKGPVQVTRYSGDLVEEVGHSKYQAARGFDHSITHQSGQDNNSEKIARYAKERLSEWPTDETIQEVADEHEDGWIIDSLAELGEDEEIQDKIESAVMNALAGGDTTALLTVQVRLEPDDEFRWPGEVPVLMEAMRQRKLSKLVTKNKADNSAGLATDLVTLDPARTVGTAEDPQNYFLGKQREKFPSLDIEEAWRSHPISEDSAVTVMNAEPLVEACTYRTLGTKVYYLPYFLGSPTPEKAYSLYTLLHGAVTDDGDMTLIERAYLERDSLFAEDKLRFYVSAVMPQQMSRYDVFGETMNGRLLYPMELAHQHNRVTRTLAFKPDRDWSAPFPTNEQWELTVPNNTRLKSVSTGWYFARTFGRRDDDEAGADDPRIHALIAVLSGNAIPVETLLSEYVDRIEDQIQEDEERRFPRYLIASQYAQLSALADEDLDLLSTEDPGKQSITREPAYEIETMDTVEEIMPIADGGQGPATKLESFIEETPALAEGGGPVNHERRGAFLLGALVGEVGSYQVYSESRSTTLIDQYPVKSVTSARIKKVAQEAIDKTVTYSRGEDRSITLFEHVVDGLRETIVQTDPDEWEIDTDDLRFYYALGVTYGMNDHPDWSQTSSMETETNE